MTKIRNTGGAGGPAPTSGPDPTENIKETAGANETTRTDTASPSTSQKTTPGDKYAAGDLKAKGDRVKTQLDSDLKNKGLSPEQKALAEKAAKDQIRFAPPYIPIGPVVTGDNIGVPGQPTSKEKNVSEQPPEKKQKDLASEAAKGQERFAPPYVPVGPVVMGDNIAAPGHVVAGETKQMNLKADQFQINDQGNLVITNEKLVEYFKSLKESGQEILLGITPKKPE